MNKKALILLLFVIGFVFLYLVYHSVSTEMTKRKVMAENKELIIGRLDTLRLMQLAYCEFNSHYAASFNDLFDYMKNGKCIKVKQTQSSLDSQILIDTSFLNPMLEILGSTKIDCEHFRYIDLQQSNVFLIETSTLEENGVTIPVFEISTPIEAFIPKQLKVGDLNTANTNGNWK